MKRDLDLIRSILLHIESVDSGKITCETIAEALIVEPKVISHHITLLVDCDYLDVIKVGTLSSSFPSYLVNRITSLGYDYLDNVRDDKVYAKTKQALKGIAGFSLDVVKQTAATVIQSLIKL